MLKFILEFFIIPNIISWIKITIRSLRIKDFFDVLCLKIIIANNAPKVPPKKVKLRRNSSETLLLLFLAYHLSAPKTIKVKIFDTTRK